MFEVILTVCMFANAYSTDLECAKQTIPELSSCGAVVLTEEAREALYHAEDNPKGEVFIKAFECKKMVPVAPSAKAGQKSA